MRHAAETAMTRRSPIVTRHSFEQAPRPNDTDDKPQLEVQCGFDSAMHSWRHGACASQSPTEHARDKPIVGNARPLVAQHNP